MLKISLMMYLYAKFVVAHRLFSGVILVVVVVATIVVLLVGAVLAQDSKAGRLPGSKSRKPVGRGNFL